MKLYEATDALEEVRAMLDASEGEWTPEIEAAFAAAEGDFTAKAERVALFVRDRLAMASANTAHAEFHTARARTYTRTADGLKAYLHRELERAGKTKVEGTLVTIALQNNPPSVIAPAWDEDALKGMAPQFVTRKPETFTLDKRAILAAAKAGEPYPDGIEIVQSQSLRIR